MTERQGWPSYYDHLLQMVNDSNRRMMEQIDEARRKQLQLETKVDGWLVAPRAEEFRGIGAYRWACTSPTKAHP